MTIIENGRKFYIPDELYEVIEKLKVMWLLCGNGIEYNFSYIMSGYSTLNICFYKHFKEYNIYLQYKGSKYCSIDIEFTNLYDYSEREIKNIEELESLILENC